MQDYKLNKKQLECISLAEESYELYYKTFSNYTNEKRIELLDATFYILKDGLKLDDASCLIIQQIISFKFDLLNILGKMHLGSNLRTVINEELNFIIKLIIYKYEIENDYSSNN